MNITLTTCLYDIRGKEGSSSQKITLLEKYLELSRHMLSVRLPMVVFTDEERIVDHVYKTRMDIGLIGMTLIVRLPFKETFFYKDLGVLEQRMREFEIINWNKEKDTPMYVLLNNNKFDFLKRTIEMNPFNSEFFFWMDMGIQHCTKATEQEWLDISQLWPSFIEKNRSQIHQLRIHTPTKPSDMSWKDYFRFIYHHVAGGFFGGHKDAVLQYITLFKDEWHKIIHEEKWWQLDEAIMTIITEKHPDKFRFFHGDYDGLLTNFIHSKKSFRLVAQTAKRHVDAYRHTLGDNVLSAIDYDCLVGTEHYTNIVTLKLCNDFHRLGGKASTTLVDVLNRHEMSVETIQGLVPNLRHMVDDNVVPFFVRWAFKNPANHWAMERWASIPERSTFRWAHLEKSSKGFAGSSTQGLPTDTTDDDPTKLLTHFQAGFSSFSADERKAMCELLETSGSLFFFWNTPSFMKEEKGNQYDNEIVKLCGFLKQNFPQLKFYMICLYANHKWCVPMGDTPEELMVFYYETPYFFKNNDISYYNRSAASFLELLLLQK